MAAVCIVCSGNVKNALLGGADNQIQGTLCKFYSESNQQDRLFGIGDRWGRQSCQIGLARETVLIQMSGDCLCLTPASSIFDDWNGQSKTVDLSGGYGGR